jgi:hypothetical protein
MPASIIVRATRKHCRNISNIPHQRITCTRNGVPPSRYRDFLPGGFVAAPIPDFVKNGVSCAGVFGFADFGFRTSLLPFC